MGYDPYKYWNSRKNPNKAGEAQPWLIDRIAGHVSDADHVFELGPGTGRTFGAYTSGQRVTTADLSRQYANVLEERARARNLTLSQHFLNGPEEAFPFEDNAFSTGLCIQVLMHVPPQYIAHTMAELSRVCRRTLIIAGVNPKWRTKKKLHCFKHDYLRLCRAMGCAADAAFIRGHKICFVLRRAGPER